MGGGRRFWHRGHDFRRSFHGVLRHLRRIATVRRNRATSSGNGTLFRLGAFPDQRIMGNRFMLCARECLGVQLRKGFQPG